MDIHSCSSILYGGYIHFTVRSPCEEIQYDLLAIRGYGVAILKELKGLIIVSSKDP